MDAKTKISDDIPTALPGSEDEDAREKLLLETTAAETDAEPDDEDTDDLDDANISSRRTKKRRAQVLQTVLGFGIFLGILVLAVSWFFRLGWFAESKAQPVSRNSPKDTSQAPVTEDEKLKMALSMVANEPKTTEASPGRIDPEKTESTTVAPPDTGSVDEIRLDGGAPTKPQSGAGEQSGLPPSDIPVRKDNGSETVKQATDKKEVSISVNSRESSSADVPGRSFFFGVTRKPPAPFSPSDHSVGNTIEAFPVKEVPRGGIPFGTLLPVRLAGSIYTLKKSGGVVRLELTRPVEGKGYSYPAGTVLIGNARGGESSRAFVTIIGLIDPVSGELVKFGGDLLGKDGASGIEGKQRRLTSQWSRFFNGLKETASSVLGSVGAIRSGGTVILSEPLRRGSESISEDLSNALIGNGKETTFIEVSAGANGYVLVTDLPKSTSEANSEVKGRGTDK